MAARLAPARRCGVVAAAWLLALPPAQAAGSSSLSLVASQDAPIFGPDGGVAGVDFASHANGAGYSIYVGMNGSGSVRRALLKFDFSALPARAYVTEARLVMALDRVPNASSQLLSLHVLTSPWTSGSSNSDVAGTPGQGTAATPGDATWYYASWPGAANPAGTRWAAPGADFLPAVVASAWVGGLGSNGAPQPYSWSGQGLADSVNAWLARPASNHGWIVTGNEGLTQSVKRFISREGVGSDGAPMAAELLPHLVLSYVIADSTTAPGDGASPVAETTKPAGPFGLQRRRAAVARPAPCCR